MTQEDLIGLANAALEVSRDKLRKTKSGSFIVIFGYDDGRAERMPEDTTEMLSPYLNIGPAKNIIFDTIRDFAAQQKATAVVFATEVWISKTTDAGNEMPREELLRLSQEQGCETLLQLGMVERTECILATAQNREWCCLLSQEFRRLPNGTVYRFAEPEIRLMPQSDFHGRQKMFGYDPAEEKSLGITG